MTEYENFEKAVEAMLKNHGPQDTVQYVINGDNVVRRLKLEDGKDVIGYDQFKARVAKENCISQTLATRIKLYTPNFFNYIKGNSQTHTQQTTNNKHTHIYINCHYCCCCY